MRPDWDEYFLAIATAVSSRASCARARCGAVIVKDKRILGTGYNGAPSGQPHCLDAGCLVEDNHCQRSIHAEVNAIIHSRGNLAGSIIYVCKYNTGSPTGSEPCRECMKVILAAGIAEFCYRDEAEVIHKVSCGSIG